MNITDRMRFFSIRSRMLATVIVVSVLLLLLGLAGHWSMARIQAGSEAATGRSTTVLEGINAIRTEMARVRLLEKDMLILYERPERMNATLVQWRASLEKTRELLTGFGAQSQNSSAKAVQDMLARLRAYDEKMQPIILQLQASAYESATTAARFAQRAVDEFVVADQLLDQLSAGVGQDLKASIDAQRELSGRIQLFFSVLSALALVLLVPTTIVNMRAICQPLQLLQIDTDAIATGDLARRIEIIGSDEMSSLQQSLLGMQAGLARIAGQLLSSSTAIASASGEIAAGNLDLSNRTEQTAGNLHLTVAGISELMASVNQTTVDAQSATRLASSASQSAQHCSAVVQQAVGSMQGIAASSRKIGDIVGLIDSIAFQTNILALNAAVEAARAGEQGRGFAVVASEVRLLAQRSATAAHEIKSLISSSVDGVDEGVKLVEQVGLAMQGIVAGVQEVDGIMAGISRAAASQASGIAQVNQSVHEIDSMTQQNSALVEQSAASAASLSEQAITLSDVARQFRIGAR